MSGLNPFPGLTQAQVDARVAAYLAASPTLVTPTIASFVNAQHNHQSAAGGGFLGKILPASDAVAAIVIANAAGAAQMTFDTTHSLVGVGMAPIVSGTSPLAQIFQINSGLSIVGPGGVVFTNILQGDNGILDIDPQPSSNAATVRWFRHTTLTGGVVARLVLNAGDGTSATILSLGGNNSSQGAWIDTTLALGTQNTTPTSYLRTQDAHSRSLNSYEHWSANGSTLLAKVDLLGQGFFAGLTITDAKNVVLGTTTGTQWGTLGGASGQKQAWWGKTPIVQPVLATGASHTVDDVITALQNLGLVRQS